MNEREFKRQVRAVETVLRIADPDIRSEIARELVNLRAWKEEAMEVSRRWDSIVDLLAQHGHAGELGEQRSEFVRRFVLRALVGEQAAREYQTATR